MNNEEAAIVLENTSVWDATTMTAVKLAIVALRTPPATGAAAMRKAIALLRNASQQSHTAHFDKTGGSGSGCPECIRARDLREKADAILRALPAPEVPDKPTMRMREFCLVVDDGGPKQHPTFLALREQFRERYGI